MKREECNLMEQTESPDLLFSLQIFLQVPRVYLFRKYDCDLWLPHSRKGLPCTHCPIRFGNSETSSVARHKRQIRLKVIEKVKLLQQDKDGCWVWREKEKAVQSRLEETAFSFYILFAPLNFLGLHINIGKTSGEQMVKAALN